jgi:hypothetical protein
MNDQFSLIVRHNPCPPTAVPAKSILTVTTGNQQYPSGKLFDNRPLTANSSQPKLIKRVQWAGLVEYSAADEEQKIVMNRKKYKPESKGVTTLQRYKKFNKINIKAGDPILTT